MRTDSIAPPQVVSNGVAHGSSIKYRPFLKKGRRSGDDMRPFVPGLLYLDTEKNCKEDWYDDIRLSVALDLNICPVQCN